MNNFIRCTVSIIGLLFHPVWAAGINANDGIAIHGYDPVAYFGDQGPLPGSKTIAHEWMGAIWRFVSEVNRDVFAENPQRYAPQYGGYCALAASQGSKAQIHPYAYSIVDDKLYLNFSKDVNNRWLSDRDRYIRQGDVNWHRLKN